MLIVMDAHATAEQALTPPTFATMMQQVERIAAALDRPLATSAIGVIS